jgi:hypothetical protein
MRAQRRRDAAYAMTLTVLLAAGVLGALLINTSMQQQARSVAQQRALLANLQLQSQTAQTEVDRQAAPWVLAQRARALHMVQATHMQVLHPSRLKATKRVNASRQRTVMGKRASPRKLIRPFQLG